MFVTVMLLSRPSRAKKKWPHFICLLIVVARFFFRF